MIVCKQCGHHNEDNDTFCGSCGRFLEWTGERVAVEEPPPPPAPEPEPDPVHHTFMERVKQAVGLEEEAPAASAPAPSPVNPPAVPVAATAGPASPTAAPTPSLPAAAAAPPAPVTTPAAPVGSARAATPVVDRPAPALTAVPISSATPAASVAPAADEPISRRPVSVAPQPVRARPVTRVREAPTRRQPGDLICGACGEGNDPVRHFCRRCGTSLDEAATVRLPWYRKLLNGFRPRRTREAGWRPNKVGGVKPFHLVWRLVQLAVGLLLVLALILFVAVPPVRTTVQARATSAYNRILHLIHPTLSPVSLIADAASSSIAGHDAKAVIDSNTTTYWAAAPSDAQPMVHIQFADFVDLAEFLVTSGPSGTAAADQFKAQPRPAKVHLLFSDGSTRDLTIADQQALQHFAIDVKHVNGVEIHVVSTYAALPGSPKLSSVAITEIEFQTRD